MLRKPREAAVHLAVVRHHVIALLTKTQFLHPPVSCCQLTLPFARFPAPCCRKPGAVAGSVCCEPGGGGGCTRGRCEGEGRGGEHVGYGSHAAAAATLVGVLASAPAGGAAAAAAPATPAAAVAATAAMKEDAGRAQQ